MTDKINDGGPAYPVACTDEHTIYYPGLSKRDVFAMAAAQGLLASGTRQVAEQAVREADALLAELAKGASQ
jgi:hypothetical protein